MKRLQAYRLLDVVNAAVALHRDAALANALTRKQANVLDLWEEIESYWLWQRRRRRRRHTIAVIYVDEFSKLKPNRVLNIQSIMGV